ncbi:hypothetical protein IAR50_004637 [Cryptococcus sp. DSM 104548]
MSTTQTTQKTTQSKQEILVVARSLQEEIAEPLATLKSEHPSEEDVEKALTSIRDSVKNANSAVPTTSQVSTSSTTTTGNPLTLAQNGIQSGVNGVGNLIGQGQGQSGESGSIEEINSAEQKAAEQTDADKQVVPAEDDSSKQAESAEEKDPKDEPASKEDLDQVGEILANVVGDVNKAVDGLTDDLKKLPLVGALIGEIDDGLKTLLFGVEVVLKGVLQVVQGLLSGLTSTLGGLGGGLLGGLL